MKILYFSWLKEKVGKNIEEIRKPEEVHNIMDLIEFSNGHKKAGEIVAGLICVN